MIKTLLSQVKEFKKPSVLAPTFGILEVILEVLIPLMMASIIDDGLEKGNMGHVVVMGIGMVCMAGCSLTCGVLAGKNAAFASTGLAKNLRQAMYENIQNYSFANIDKYSTAGLVTRLTTDVTNIQNSYQMVLRMCVRAPIMLICALFMSFAISGQLSLVFVGAILFLGTALAFIMLHVHPIFTQVFQKYDDLNSSVQENVNAIRVVKAYVREGYETKKFQKANENLYHMFVRAERILTLNSPIMMFTMYTCILLISWLGAKMVVGGTLSTGQLMSLFTYVMNILMSLMMLSMVFVMITMSRASGERIAEVIQEQSDLRNGEHPVTKIQDGSIVFRKVSFSYQNDKEKEVLQEIDLSIASGETIGILGGTGSAKTSLVQLIPRLYDATEGTVEVGGLDVRQYDIESLRNEVAMVLQKNVLFSGTIQENLRWGDKEASEEEIVRVCKLAQADEFIQNFPDKYQTYIEQGGTNVSGGQKQRLCIARALLKKPKILILDDSTSAVDTKTDALIRKAFREEIPDTTKLIIAQRISSVQEADRIIVLHDGKVDGIGTHKELLENNAIYQDIYRSQLKGGSEDGR